jgi:hypothetical protein
MEPDVSSDVVGWAVIEFIFSYFYRWKKTITIANVIHMALFMTRLVAAAIYAFFAINFFAFLPIMLDFAVTPMFYFYVPLISWLLTRFMGRKYQWKDGGKTWMDKNYKWMEGGEKGFTGHHLRMGGLIWGIVIMIIYIACVVVHTVWVVWSVAHYSILIFNCGNVAYSFYGVEYNWGACVMNTNEIWAFAVTSVVFYSFQFFVNAFLIIYTLVVGGMYIGVDGFKLYDKYLTGHLTQGEIGQLVTSNKIRITSKMQNRLMNVQGQHRKLDDSDDETLIPNSKI